MTIGTLAARILMDASGVKAGMGLTRAEMRLTRQAFVDSRSDAEKLESALATLASARDKGAFQDEQQYAAAIASVRAELDPVVKLEQERAAAQQAAAATAAAAQEQAMARGKALSDSLATADEKRGQRLAEANDLLNRAAISQETYNRAVRQMDAEKFKELGTSIRNAGAATAAVAGGISAALTLIGKDLLDVYAVQESAERKLQGAMQANATYSAAAFAQYKQFASGLQAVTTTGDETTISMLQTAESLGLTGDAAERATKNAIGMQAALGLDAQSAMKMTSALEQGNTTLLTRYLPSLRAIEDPAERAAAAQEALARMFGVATAEADTYAGRAQQLANAWGDVKEEFGAFLSDALMPVLDVGRDLIDWLAQLDDGTKQAAVYVGLATAGLSAFVAAGGSVVAISGQMTIWYGALTASATGAKIAQMGLNTTIGVGYVAAAVAAAGAGYALGKSLYDLTATAKTNHRVIDDLRAGLESLRKVDFAGVAQEDLETYIASTERQIAKIQEHNQELQAAQGWSNFWQANADLIDQNAAQIDVLQAKLNEAKIAMAKGDTAPQIVEQTAIDAVDKLTASLREQITTAGMDAYAIEQWKLQTEGATATQINAVAALQRQAEAAQAAAVLRADTQKLTEALQLQIDTVGKTEAEVQRLQLAARGLSAEWLQTIAAMQARLGAAQRAEETRQAVERLTDSLREQIATSGMSAEQIELWKLTNQGATAEQLGQVDALQQQAAAIARYRAAQQAAADSAKSLQDSIAETTRRLREQIATAGMSADQIELWKLQQQGATPQQLAAIAALQRQAAATKNLGTQQQEVTRATQDWTAATRGSGEALDRVEAYRKMLAREAQAAKTAKPPANQPTAVSPTLTPSWGPVPTRPPVPPVSVGIQPTWSPTPAAPPVPPVSVGIQPTWSPTPAAPPVPPVSVGIQPTWSPTPAAPTVPPVPAGIQPTWSPTPAAPTVPPVPAEIQSAWADILQPPTVPAIAAGIQPGWEPTPAPPAVPGMAAGIQSTWSPTPPPPAVPPVPAEIQTAWADILQPPALPGLAAGIQSTWQPTPAPPAVAGMAAGIQSTWQPTPAPPAVPPVPAEIQTAWADILQPPALSGLAAGIQTTWQPTPPAPTPPPIAAGIQSAWQPTPAPPAVPGIAAGIQSTWQPTPAPPAVPGMAAGIQSTWQPTPPAPAVSPIAGAIIPQWQPIPEPPAVAPIEVDIVGTWTVPTNETVPAVRSGREFASSPAPAAQSTGGKSDAYLSQAVELLKRIATAAEEDRITIEETP